MDIQKIKDTWTQPVTKPRWRILVLVEAAYVAGYIMGWVLE